MQSDVLVQLKLSKELDQLLVEETFSRKNIWNIVKEELKETKLVTKAIKRIKKYLSTKYSYKSKNKRIRKLLKAINNKDNELSVEDIALDILVTVLINSPRQVPIQGIAGRVATILPHKDIWDRVLTAMELITVCRGKAYKFIHAYDEENEHDTLVVKPKYMLEDSTIEEINRLMYLPPMITTPKEWSNNHNGGYLSAKHSLVLNNPDNTEYQDYKAINTLQDIPWCIDEESREYLELPKDISTMDDIDLENYSRYIESSKKVEDMLLANGNRFYFMWEYDNRGRMYSHGYHINLQSSQYKKSLITFDEEYYIPVERS